MDPREVFHRIFNVYILNAQKLCGLEILQPNYTPHKVTFGALGFVCSYIVAAVYTIAAYDTDIKFKCLCVVPGIMQILVKFLTMVRFYKPMADKIQLLQHIYEVNHRPGTAYYEALVEWSQFAFKVCRSATIVLTVVIVYTLAFNLLTNYGNPLLATFVYGVDETTAIGRWTLFVFHFLVISIWCIGILCADNLMAMFVVHMIPMMQILANMFEQMNDRLRAGIRFEDSVEFDGFFRNTIQVHKDICDYISGIADYYYFYSMFEVYTDALTLCVGIYTILEVREYQVSSLMGFTMAKLLVFCLLGTIVENTTGDIYSTIIQSDWNSMPIKTQKMVGLMMARAQNPAILMAGTIPLNLDTFVNVMKTVYSVGMLLVESTG